MHFICVVTASYTLDCLKTKNPWLVFQLKLEILKQKFVVFSFMEKMPIIQFHSMENNAYHTISSMEKMLILLFSYTYFRSMEMYERV